MKFEFNKKYLVGLLVIILLVGFICYGESREKVVTNLDKSDDSVGISTIRNVSKNTKKDKAEIKKEEKEKDKDKEKTDDKEDADTKEGEKKEAATEKGSSDDVVVIDGVTYKGYKGPVQGEIKYKEGRPAKQNSVERKASGDIQSPYKVDLVVTKDFGHNKMFAKNVGLVKDEVGMEVLFRNLDIQTAYGGGFVNAINGLESKFTFYTGSQRKKLDWFYWVNGILAPIGIAEYRPQPGDTIWWDYHDWSTTMFIPSVIGSYPQPFKSGFWGKNPGTVIMYTDGFKGGAENLKKSLIAKGVKKIDTVPYNPSLLGNDKRYIIVLGPWDEISAQSQLLQKVNKKSKFKGVYVEFSDGKLHSLDFKGNIKGSYSSGAGAIYTYADGIGSLNPIWLVTGIDESGTKRALNVLLSRPGAIKMYFGAVITPSNQVINVPYLN